MFFGYPMGRNTLADVLDKTSIQEQIALELYHIDQQRWDKAAEVYEKEAVINTLWGRISPADIAAVGQSRPFSSKSKIFDTIVWKKGSRAVAECVAMYETRCPLDGDTVDLSSHVRFHYRLEKTGNVWKIRYKIPIFEKDTLFSCYTEGAYRSDRPALESLRGSYRNLIWLAERLGGSPDRDLPGEDRPELVDAVYQESDCWLNADT